MKTSGLRFLCCLLILFFSVNTLVEAKNKHNRRKTARTMEQVITSACEKDPYGPKCIGNLDAHDNYERARRDDGWYYDRHCGRDGCGDGWSSDWRH
jgi:hypothetical protein